MGGTPLTPMPTEDEDYGLAAGGRIIHELGVTRMGNDPNTSVLNKNCQAHDAKNVFVADGGPFVSQADKNCTWTILALAMRTSAFIAEQRKTGAIQCAADCADDAERVRKSQTLIYLARLRGERATRTERAVGARESV